MSDTVMVGQTLGHFRITARLGSGGMGTVYRAHDEKLQRTVAIKVVGRETSTTADDRAKIVEEARASSALNHPHICTVYETGEIEGQAYIAMEYVEGRPLSELIPAHGLPLEAVIRYGAQIADALEHAHSHGVVHRDLKTPNVVVGTNGRAKVLDFGLARRVPQNLTEADTRSSDAVAAPGLAGTLPYMPPEVLLGEPGNERSDIWALGVTLFEMSTGELPFKGRNDFELTAGILRSPPQVLPAHVPAMVRGVIQRCLAKDPAHRYQRAGEVRAALEAIQSDIAIDVRPARQVSRPVPWRWLAAAAVLMACVVAGIVWSRRERESIWQNAASRGHLTQAMPSDTPIYEPAISPDGKMLSYVAEDANGRVDLFVRQIAGGALVKLTDDAASERGPRFSPDGDRIAFTRQSAEGGPPELRIVPSLGGDPLATISGAGDAAWSPDGRQLAFMRRTAGSGIELTIASIDGSNARGLLQSDSAYPFVRQPAWSPDGRDLAVVRGTGGIAGEIWSVPASGGTPQRLFTDAPEVFADSPVFTPDGFGLIHSSNRGGATNLWVYPLNGGTMIRLTTGPGPDTDPTVTRTGQVAFVNSRWRNVLELHAMDGNGSRTLVSHSPFLWGPAFSSDGTEIAVSRSEVDGSWHIWSVPVSGGTPRRLTATEGGEVYPRYAPDGQSLFFHTWKTPRRIGRVGRQGGRAELLSFGDGNDAFPDVSPDGRLLLITRTEKDAERLYVAPSSGGAARLLTTTPGALGRWSPDGRSIAFSGNRAYSGGIFVVSPEDGRSRRLTESGGWPVWLPDGRRLAYLVARPDGRQEIRSVSIDGTPVPAFVAIRFRGTNHPFAVSPDGKWAATTNSVYVSDEIWLLDASAVK